MKQLLFVFAAIIMAACSTSIDKGEVAAHVAKQYYDTLIAGNYDAFVQAVYQPAGFPKRYRDQLIENAKMFIAQQQAEHRGLDSVQILTHRADTAHRTANVFLLLHYADSTSEQVVVPMIEHNGTWLMR